MKRISLFFIMMQLSMSTSLKAQKPFTKQVTYNIMRLVADWQIADFNSNQHHEDVNWANAALYIGMADWAELSSVVDQYDVYYQWLDSIGRRNDYQLGRKIYHADYMAVGQTYMALYEKYKNPEMLWHIQARLDWIIDHPSQYNMHLDESIPHTCDRWSWCDALFMAPPLFAHMYTLTGNNKYIHFMNQEWTTTYHLLYDNTEHLFYRDTRYLDKREANGQKIFWGRGAGWVAAGTANLLRHLPAKDNNRKFYEKFFIENCTRLASLQCADGYWHASLLNPESYPSPETSATGLITYALAYGINSGLLERNKFLPIVIKGWQSMLKAVEPNGKLGYVQPIGADPRMVTRNMTEVYGVGAFLAAGCQIYKLIDFQQNSLKKK